MLMVNSFMRLNINDEYNNTVKTDGKLAQSRIIKYAEGVFDQIICAPDE